MKDLVRGKLRQAVKQLDRVRESKGVTKTALAAKMDTDTSTLRSVINEHNTVTSKCSLNYVERMAKALGCEVEISVFKDGELL